MDNIPVNRTSGQLIHAIDFAYGVNKQNLTDALDYISNNSSDIDHAIDFCDNITVLKSSSSGTQVSRMLSSLSVGTYYKLSSYVSYYSEKVGSSTSTVNVSEPAFIFVRSDNVLIVSGKNVRLLTPTETSNVYTAKKLSDVGQGGGGGTSFTPDSTLYLEDSVLGIDFAEDTGSGLETEKAVRSNEFNTAMETISTTFGGFVSQLAGKEDAFNVGKGLSLANGVMSADVRRWLFVTALPSTNIDENAVYLMLNSRMFPSVSNLVGTIDGEQQKAAVTYDEGIGYRFIRFNTKSNKFYGTGGAIAFEWELFTTDGVSWTKVSQSAEDGDTAWTTAMGWTSSSTGAAYTNVLWANSTFQYIAAHTHWNTDNNTARIDGTAIDTSTLPPYEYMASQYDGTAWQSIGVFDFAELFSKVYSKDEVDTLISTAIADVSALIGGAS